MYICKYRYTYIYVYIHLVFYICIPAESKRSSKAAYVAAGNASAVSSNVVAQARAAPSVAENTGR